MQPLQRLCWTLGVPIIWLHEQLCAPFQSPKLRFQMYLRIGEDRTCTSLAKWSGTPPVRSEPKVSRASIVMKRSCLVTAYPDGLDRQWTLFIAPHDAKNVVLSASEGEGRTKTSQFHPSARRASPSLSVSRTLFTKGRFKPARTMLKTAWKVPSQRVTREKGHSRVAMEREIPVTCHKRSESSLNTCQCSSDITSLGVKLSRGGARSFFEEWNVVYSRLETGQRCQSNRVFGEGAIFSIRRRG